VTLVDELASGMAPATAPELGPDLDLSPGVAAGLAIAAFYSLALVEAPLLAWADRARVRVVSAIALFALAAVTGLAALAPNVWWLMLALAAYGPASGVATTAAEGVLVESRPDQRERTMTRIMIAAVIGDLMVPATLVALAWFGLGWRWALGLAALSAFVLATTHALSRSLDVPMATDDEDDDDEERPPLRELWHLVRKHPALIGWSSLGIATGALDETLVAFGLVHLAEHTGADSVTRSIALAVCIVGELGALFVLDRLLARYAPMKLLFWTSTGAVACLVVIALTTSAVAATIALGLLGAFVSGFHPIVKARAYAALPGRPAIVNAVSSLFIPADIALPLLLALIAGELGSSAAMLTFVTAPLALGFAALVAMRKQQGQ
jgi:MFS family permease